MIKKSMGVVPDAQLYTYAIGCGRCIPSVEFSLDAINAAIQDGVRVISMSQGSVNTKGGPCPRNDLIGMELLDAFEKALAFVLVGNEGPLGGTAMHASPWVFTVGGCTSGEIVVSDIEIAIATSEKNTSNVPILGRHEDREGDFFIIDKIQGVSLNMIKINFHKECVLYGDDTAGQISLVDVRPECGYKSVSVTNGLYYILGCNF
ncbi:hypothetical protein OROMI_022016 [Orobanche minor]